MRIPILLIIFSVAMHWMGPAKAATIDLRFNPDTGLKADSMYPGSSTASVQSSGLTGILATLTGRGYGVEQTGKERWGIAAGPLAWNGSLKGWTVRNGFVPDKVGGTVSTSASVQVDASYLSIILSGVMEGTLFKDVALTFADVTFLRPANAWVGTSADAFATATSVKFTSNQGSQQLSATLPDFTWTGSDPLEIRIYGVIGSDEGAFNGLSIGGEAIPPAAVPEPDIRLLLTSLVPVAILAYRRRRETLVRSAHAFLWIRQHKKVHACDEFKPG